MVRNWSVPLLLLLLLLPGCEREEKIASLKVASQAPVDQPPVAKEASAYLARRTDLWEQRSKLSARMKKASDPEEMRKIGLERASLDKPWREMGREVEAFRSKARAAEKDGGKVIRYVLQVDGHLTQLDEVMTRLDADREELAKIHGRRLELKAEGWPKEKSGERDALKARYEEIRARVKNDSDLAMGEIGDLREVILRNPGVGGGAESR